MRKQEESNQQEAPQGFDLEVTKRHPKTGLIVEKNPYILRVVGEGTNKRQYLERPAGSGNLWNFNGDAIGVWDKTKPEGKRFLKGEKHIDWHPPLTEDEKVSIENAELRKELKAALEELKKKNAPAEEKKVSTKGTKNQGA